MLQIITLPSWIFSFVFMCKVYSACVFVVMSFTPTFIYTFIIIFYFIKHLLFIHLFTPTYIYKPTALHEKKLGSTEETESEPQSKEMISG